MPRPLSHRLFNLLLAVLVLAASVGLSVQHHTCRLSGRSKTLLTLPGQVSMAGCTSPAGAAAFKDSCCNLDSHLHKLTTPAYELKAGKVPVPSPLFVAVLPAQLWPLPLAARPLAGPAGARWYAADSSPPRTGRQVLLLACTLVV